MLKSSGERIPPYRTLFCILIEFLKSVGEVQAERYSYYMVFIIRLEYFRVCIFLKAPAHFIKGRFKIYEENGGTFLLDGLGVSKLLLVHH